MKELYLMRHGETLFNALHKIQGWCDSPLTEAGIAGARAAGELLRERGVSFDHAFASTAERAADTLENVLDAMGTPMPYERLKAIRERGFGTFEAESETLNPPIRLYDEFFPIYGGETSAQVRERMVAALTEVMEREDVTRAIACSHAGACRCFTMHLGDPSELLPKGRVPNCAILHFTYEDGRFSLVEVLVP